MKRVVKLRERRGRDREQCFVIEGYRELLRAVEVELPLAELFICPELYLGANEPALVARARARCGAVVLPVTAAVFGKLAYRDRPEGLLAVAPQPRWTLERLPEVAHALYVVATAIEKPGNLGTMLRCADAAGAHGVIVCDEVTDVFNPNVVRASLGTLFTVPVAEARGAELRDWLRARGVRMVATSPVAATCFWDLDLTGSVAIVLGSEQLGLTDEWLTAADLTVHIPMRGHADSLNVAMATSVLLYEAARQRRAPPHLSTGSVSD